MRDIVHNIKAVIAVPPATRSASIDGAAVDLLGFDSVALVVATGAVTGAGDMSVKLQESDTTVAGDFTDVDAEHLQGAIAGSLATGATAKVGYRGFKRYLRAVMTFNGGTSVTTSALFILGNAADRPVA
ncbi:MULTISPECIES: hypothetical protein [Rhizobium/Agrobacterium group]|uniref:Uncharacterized protein n=2 Tax=Rhizobium/Agrobacterium group TaxID=227290 RepID=B9JSB5_ALLAM|nr:MULTISPECIES: hypothetical protein [Rhizobium/Agrobacterium group]ACM35608.1 conserved hypothetical protein [Allorhizobium ampelinum S4]MUO29453.1 hypothetical protein [Agrobacterium vitis]MUO42628.1 hypothetical protein [Agrobacterium vitis]MUP10597.1 hypothetical protein [Agrobacterium vitis]